MARRPGRAGKHSGSGRLRIVAGKWRSRVLRIADAPGLRPTSERIRETLFNWLAPMLPGARCLDLFAGTGALGLEALSRGAASVVFVERSATVADLLRENVTQLGSENAAVVQTDALRFLATDGPERFDIIFLDPPFADADYEELCRLLQKNGWLAAGARVYLEQPTQAEKPKLPDGWEVLKEKTAGKVRYFLLEAPQT